MLAALPLLFFIFICLKILSVLLRQYIIRNVKELFNITIFV